MNLGAQRPGIMGHCEPPEVGGRKQTLAQFLHEPL